MKTPFQIKIENMQKSFIHDNAGQQDILKAEKQVAEKPTAEEYAKGLGAEKFNPKKLKREMEHHKNMAKLTGDAGHAKVYETLSKTFKDHDSHEDGDKKEKQTLSSAKSAKTKAKNAKSKAKQAMEDSKAKTAGKTGAKEEKGAQKPTDKKKVEQSSKKQDSAPKSTKGDDKYSDPKKKEVKGKPKTEGDNKHVEVKVIINKSEHELELLKKLGITTEDVIEKASKYGKGKHYENVAVQGKTKMYTKHVLVGDKNEPVKHKINQNAKAGGDTAFGALINNLVLMKIEETGLPKGIIQTELAYAMGYGIVDGKKKIDKHGNYTDVKSSVYKIIQGKANVDKTKKLAAGAYFGHSEAEMQDLEEKAVAGEPMKVAEADLEQIKADSTGYNYDDVKALINSSLSMEEKTMALLELGVRDAGKISQVVGEDDPFKTMTMMIKNGYDHNSEDGFDIFALEEGYVASIANKPPEDRFAGYRMAVSMLINKDITLAAAFGDGGVGKTYNAREVLKAHKMRPFKKDNTMTPNGDDYDYVVIKGRGSMSHVLARMYEHRDKLIVFDDFDSVIKPTNGKNELANILKAGLDGGEGERWVEHGIKDLKTSGDDVVPDPFKFDGRCLIITNLKEEDMPQPIVDRAVGNTFDLSMTKIERLSLMSRIYATDSILSDGKEVDVPNDIRRSAFEFMKKYSNNRLVSNKNGGAKITPRTFKGVALLMKNLSQMSEKQLRAQYDPNGGKGGNKGKSMQQIQQIIQDNYLRMLL